MKCRIIRGIITFLYHFMFNCRQASVSLVLEGMHHEALEDNCLTMDISTTVYNVVKTYITRWS